MYYRIFVTGWTDAWDIVDWLDASFTMVGRDGYADPVFECGVFHADELRSLFRGSRSHIPSVEMIEVYP